MIEAVLAEAGCRLAGLDGLAVTIGPGSFTGIRTGLAMARGLALVTGLRILPITTLQALAQVAAREAGAALPLLAVLDARRGQVFCQSFSAGGEPLDMPRCLLPEDAAMLARGPSRLVGNGVPLVLACLSPQARLGLVSSAGRLDARAVALAAFAALARGGSSVAGPEVRPLYLRPADARPDAGRALLRVGA